MSACSTNLLHTNSGNSINFIINSSEEEAVRKAAVLMLNPEGNSAFENQLVFVIADFPVVFSHISHWYLSWNTAGGGNCI